MAPCPVSQFRRNGQAVIVILTGMSKTPDDSEDNLFQEMMADVKPLPTDNRVAHTPPKPSPRPRQQADEAVTDSAFIERDFVTPLNPEESLFFARPGLQHRLLQRLKRGEFPVEGRLDLHGRTIAEAGDDLASFLQEARENGCRCVIVIHGKGQRSQEGKPVLKSQVNHWLQSHDAVLAFSSAQPRHGGSGAVYILLRRHQ